MTITFKLFSRVLKGGKKTIRLRVYNRVKNSIQDFKITTGLKVYPKFWNKEAERVTKDHPDFEVINNKLSEIKQRRESLLNRFDAGVLSFDAVCNQIMSNSDMNTLDDFIEFKIKELKSDVTYNDYKVKLAGFKKLIGVKGKLTFTALAKKDLIVKAHSNAQKRQKEGTIASRSYNGYIGTIKTIVNLASYLDYTDLKLDIPNMYLSIDKTRDKNQSITKNKGHKVEDVLESINNITSLKQWEAVSQWMLMFMLRGFYPGDIVKGLKQVNIQDTDQNQIGNQKRTYAIDEIYIYHHRSKSVRPMYVHIFQKPIFSLIRKLKFVAVYNHADLEIGGKTILADINDNLSIFDYDMDNNSESHKKFWKHRQRRLAVVGGLRIIKARKTFNQTAQRLEISSDVRSLLLGQSASNNILNEHYNDNTIPELLDKVDEAHRDVLEMFRCEEILDRLLVKLKYLVNKNKLPGWLLCESPVFKNGRDITVVTGIKGSIDNPEPINTNIVDSKFRKYFSKYNSTEVQDFSITYPMVQEFIDAEQRLSKIKELIV